MKNDWTEIFAPMVWAILTGKNPYDVVENFVNPPWLFLPLLPVAWAPWWLASLFPLIVLLWIAWKRRKPWMILIVATSFPFIVLSAYAIVDWVVLIGVYIRGPIGAILVSTKPQAGGLAVLADLKKAETWRERAKLLLPVMIVALFFTLLYPNWIAVALTTPNIAAERNISLFPYSIPVGLVALWLCWRDADPLWGTLASLTLSPYFGMQSLVPFLVLLTDRDWRLGVGASLGLWGVVVLVVLGFLPLQF